MIEIREKTSCCGCTACQQVCPHGSIAMREDEHGFLYPKVDVGSCVDCHLCEKVCPVINRYDSKEAPLHSYLAKTADEAVRAQSSSGGIFTELARLAIERGGVVFGVRFNKDWQAEYDYCETVEGISAFRGSKYVQAYPRKAYTQVLGFLKEGRYVLFTGTPCTVSGLNHFLRKKYDNLLTMDVVCHSIPSPKVWARYLKETERKKGMVISNLTFRDKSQGWTNYSLRIDMENTDGEKTSIVESHFDNSYMRGMMYDLFTRPSCSACPARNYTSGSDLTIADAWKINNYHQEKNDERGISHLLVNTAKGQESFLQLVSRIDCMEIDYREVEPFSVHAPLTRSCKPSPFRKAFYDKIGKGFHIDETSDLFNNKYDALKKRRQTYIYRILRRIYKCFNP